MSSWTVPPKHGGEAGAAAVLQELPELEIVPDTVAVHYDARTISAIVAGDALELRDLDVLEAGRHVEIKTAMVVVTDRQRRGRFNLRRIQHEELLEDDGVYLFGVCEPTPSRDVLAMSAVPADVVEDLRGTWRQPEDRYEYTQLAWSNVVDPDLVGEGGR